MNENLKAELNDHNHATENAVNARSHFCCDTPILSISIPIPIPIRFYPAYTLFYFVVVVVVVAPQPEGGNKPFPAVPAPTFSRPADSLAVLEPTDLAGHLLHSLPARVLVPGAQGLLCELQLQLAQLHAASLTPPAPLPTKKKMSKQSVVVECIYMYVYICPSKCTVLSVSYPDSSLCQRHSSLPIRNFQRKWRTHIA